MHILRVAADFVQPEDLLNLKGKVLKTARIIYQYHSFLNPYEAWQ